MSAVCSDCICIWCQKHETCKVCTMCLNKQEEREKAECPHALYEDKDGHNH